MHRLHVILQSGQLGVALAADVAKMGTAELRRDVARRGNVDIDAVVWEDAENRVDNALAGACLLLPSPQSVVNIERVLIILKNDGDGKKSPHCV
jgi:hypothetical protein